MSGDVIDRIAGVKQGQTNKDSDDQFATLIPVFVDRSG
jgi:hypothetical protein